MDNIGLMSETVNFIQGSKRNYDSSTMQGGVYFSKDSKEILLNGESYGNAVPTDEEDLTSVNGALQLKDREVNAGNFQSKGYVILRKNLVQQEDGSYKNILTSDMINQPNTIYEIRYDFDLNRETINVPENCTLKFEGGSLMNGHLYGKCTKIKAGLYKIFNSDISVAGDWDIEEAYPEWFGAKADGITDSSDSILCMFNSVFQSFKFTNGIYCISKPIHIVLGKRTIEICINKNAEIRAIKAMDYMLYLDNNSDYTFKSDFSSINITGAGIINGNFFAEICLTFNNSRRTKIKGLTIKNYTSRGLKLSYDSNNGSFRINKMIFVNESDNENPIGIECNVHDTILDDIIIINNKIAIINNGSNNLFSNIHSWLYNGSLYSGSIVIDNYAQNCNLFHVIADTVDVLTKIHINNTRMILNQCVYIRNNNIVSEDIAKQGKECVVLKESKEGETRYIYTNIIVFGGWFKFTENGTVIRGDKSYNDSVLIGRPITSNKGANCLGSIPISKCSDDDISLQYAENGSLRYEDSRKAILFKLDDRWRYADGSRIDTPKEITVNDDTADFKTTYNTSKYSAFLKRGEEKDDIVFYKEKNIFLTADGWNAKYSKKGNVRPIFPNNLKLYYRGFVFYDITLNSNIYWDGEKWIDYCGNQADAKKQGTTEERPSSIQIGFIYKDITLDKLILWDGSEWY